MDCHHFDRLTRTLSEAGTRRGLLGFVATLPLFGGLRMLMDPDETEAKGRRKRRKKKKRQCKPESKAKTCAGKCGRVKNNCKKTMDCGPCECSSDAECAAAGLGNLCCDGACVDGECCDSSACENPTPACIDNACAACTSSGQCPSGQICVDGLCEACMVCESGCDYTTVQQAIDDPQAGETILICPGTYGAITVNRPVRLVGAGDGPDNAANTVLDALEQGCVVDIGFGLTVILERLRVTGGTFNGLGAGVRNEGTLTMTTCTVTGNTTTNGPGAGIFSGSVATLTLTDCTVSDNETMGASGSRNGAGIAIFGGTVNLTGCTVSDNTSSAGGGGIQNGGTLTLDDCTIEKNRAEGGDGGGIRTGGGTVTLNGGSVTENFASGEGGGIFNGTLPEFDGVILKDCNVTENRPNNCAGNPVAGTCGS